MSALSWVGGGFPPALGLGAQTVFGSVGGGYQDGQSTEARASIHSAAGTYSLLSIEVVANNGTITARFRKGAANGNQVISSGASGTGIFTDVTNSDAALTTDLVDVSFVSTGATTQYGPYGLQFASSGSVTSYYSNGASTSGVQTGAMFQPFTYTGGTWGGNATEATGQTKLRAAGTLSNLTTFQTNGFQTYKTRINGVTGNLSVAGAVGFAEDSTHTDAVAAADLLCMTCAATGGEITYQESVRFTSSASNHDMMSGAGPSGAGITSTTSVALHSFIISGLAEASAQMRCPAAFRLSNLRCYVVGAAGAAATLRSRIGGSNGAQVVSIAATTAGWFEDVTNTDTLAGGDLVNSQVTIAASSTPIVQIAATLGPASSNGTATGALGAALTLHAMAATAAGVQTGAATGALGSALTLHAMAAIAVAGAKIASSKVVGYATVGPPNTTIVAPKVVAAAITGPVDTNQVTVKVVAYAVLGPAPPRRPTGVRVIIHR